MVLLISFMIFIFRLTKNEIVFTTIHIGLGLTSSEGFKVLLRVFTAFFAISISEIPLYASDIDPLASISTTACFRSRIVAWTYQGLPIKPIC